MVEKNSRRVVHIALFVSLSLIMYLVESLMPPVFAFAPGAKLGLANVVSLCALVLLGVLESFLVVTLRCLLAAFLVGNPVSLMYSLPSAIVSLSSMTLLYVLVFPKISLMSISFVSAIVFNVVQLFVASFVVQNIYIMFYLPVMFLASAGAGIFVGLVAFYIIKHAPTNIFLRQQ